MDFLKAEIAKKRKQVEQLTIEKEKKYFKRSELFGEEETTSECENEPSKVENTEMPIEELRDRLRHYKEPVIYFGENIEDMKVRLKEAEANGCLVPEYIKKENTSVVPKSPDNSKKDEDEKRFDVRYDEGKDLKWEDIEEEAKSLGDNDVSDSKIIANFIRYSLTKWANDLNARSFEEKSSTEGRFQASIQKETVTHIKPLLKDLDKNYITSDICRHLSIICRHIIVDKDQIKANNAYMEMAIGNAPWPVGVTRSGIHQRPSSSRMYVSNIAHVLNDEKQRKYIQGFKRLITKQFEKKNVT